MNLSTKFEVLEIHTSEIESGNFSCLVNTENGIKTREKEEGIRKRKLKGGKL